MNKQEKHLLERTAEWAQAHREELAADIARLVAIESVCQPDSEVKPFGPGCRRVLDAASQICGRYGFAMQNHEYYAGTVMLPGTQTQSIGVFCHLDVVPAGDGWQTGPYEPFQSQGYLVGRGSRDNKGPAMASLYVLRCLKDIGIQLRHSVLLYFGCAEENGMEDIQWYLARHGAPEFSYTPDAPFSVCYGEKGVLRAQLRCRLAGSNLLDFHGGQASNTVADSAQALLADVPLEVAAACIGGREGFSAYQTPRGVCVTATGTAKHAAFPEGSVNAIGRLAGLLHAGGLVTGPAVEAMAFLASALGTVYGEGLDIAFSDEASGPTTCVGGMAWMEDGQLVQDVNVRYAVTADVAQMRRRLERRCGAHGFEAVVLQDSAPAYMPRTSPAVAVMDGAVRAVYGDRFRPYVMGGGTYARKLPNAVAFGPATEAPSPYGGAHQANEGVLVDELLKAICVYTLALVRLDRIL